MENIRKRHHSRFNADALRENDNWRASQEAEIIATTVPPTNDREAAVCATLVPGVYTAVVRGEDATIGVALGGRFQPAVASPNESRADFSVLLRIDEPFGAQILA